MFKKRFEQLCNERKTSPAAVCEAIGLSNSVYSKWNENSIPRNTTLLKIADFFNVSVEYLKGETDNPLPHSDQIKEYLPYEKRGMRPVIGLASAGVGVIAEEMILGWQYVDDEFDNENCFWIKIAGDSMSPKIDDGDLVLIQREVDIEDGDIVVAVVDRQDGFIKQVHFEENILTLHSFNPYYPDMVFRGNEIKQVRFVGKAREVKRIL
jgi:repressor LexA|nr:MAG TPA: Repressor protein CI [Caudoviricetes sp.]